MRLNPTTVFLSTLSLRRATVSIALNACCRRDFYPRSPCGERPLEWYLMILERKISIHALLAESDKGGYNVSIDDFVFLSTLSLRRAIACWYIKEMTANISIHALLAESEAYRVQLGNMVSISIHALLAESDTAANEAAKTANISIHALLAESDGAVALFIRRSPYFYPRSPCGERERANRLAHAPPHISIHALLAESESIV